MPRFRLCGLMPALVLVAALLFSISTTAGSARVVVSHSRRRIILPLRYTVSERRDEPIPMFCRRP